MGKLEIRDDSIWIKHIQGDERLRSRISALSAGDVLDLEIDGIVGRWERMRNGADGRPTLGIKPIETMRQVWARHWKANVGSMVSIREVVTADSYLAALTPLMSEWDSAEDEAAYGGL